MADNSKLDELRNLVMSKPAFKAPPPPIYRGPESADEDVDGYPPAPTVAFTGNVDADGQPELVAKPVKGIVPKMKARVADVPQSLVAAVSGGQPPSTLPPPAPAPAVNGARQDMTPGIGDVTSLKPSLPPPENPAAPGVQPHIPHYAGMNFPAPQAPVAPQVPLYGQPVMAPPMAPPAPPMQAGQGAVLVEMSLSSLKMAMTSLQVLESSGIIPQQRGLAYRQWELLEEVQRVLGRLNAPGTPR